jgi:hypothetical protein
VDEAVTRWEQFYRWIGGTGAENPEPWGDWRYAPLWAQVPGEIARVLLRLGFLSRDPYLDDRVASWFVNHRWQWQFWRGPYRAMYERVPQTRAYMRGLRPPSWWGMVLDPHWWRP